jgi:Zn-dependent protease with chaperone function
MFSLFIFLAVYSYITHWTNFRYLAKRLLSPGRHFSSFNNQAVLDHLKSATGLQFDMHLVDSPRIFGMMPGVPNRPVMLVSQGAVERLSPDGLEWLLLHEAAHCLHWHAVFSGLIFVAVGSVGLAMIGTLQLGWWWSLFLAVIFSVMWFQLNRLLELQADEYALAHMQNPQGMIEANEIMEKMVDTPIYKDELLHRLFTPHLTFRQRVEMARAKLERQ